jgi:hypothetical protein
MEDIDALLDGGDLAPPSGAGAGIDPELAAAWQEMAAADADAVLDSSACGGGGLLLTAQPLPPCPEPTAAARAAAAAAAAVVSPGVSPSPALPLALQQRAARRQATASGSTPASPQSQCRPPCSPAQPAFLTLHCLRGRGW